MHVVLAVGFEAEPESAVSSPNESGRRTSAVSITSRQGLSGNLSKRFEQGRSLLPMAQEQP